MKKRIMTFLAAFILLVGMLPFSAQALGSLSNFAKVKTYTNGQFQDVTNEWYAQYVQVTYEYGLIDGATTTKYEPKSNLTIASAIKLAACLHSIYSTGTANFSPGTTWYQPYVDYALNKGIISSAYSNYGAYAKRSDFAMIFANALPDEALTALNKIDGGAIPDVSFTDTYGPAVYKLYRAGILTGSDSARTFFPNNNIRRDEVAAVVARMASASYRQQVTLLSKDMSATDIAARCAPAVFYIALYDAKGVYFGCASGFFISSSGLAVTNYHVIEYASSAIITTIDGKTFNTTGVYDYSEKYDLALIQVDGKDFPYLSLGDSTPLMTGSSIYAIGYPRGIAQTFTQGSITNAAHTLNGVSHILIDAAISPGSSGGALLNTKGQVIGVTTAYYEGTQNLNLAVPIQLINSMSRSKYVPLYTVAKPTYSITASPSAVTVTKDGIAAVTITEPSGNPDFSLVMSVDDETIISCNWGEWTDDYNCPIYITGLSAGTTTVTLYLADKNDQILAATTINVTVNK